MLKNSGVDCILVESGKICNGITGNTTAKITIQHGLIYHKLIQQFGQEKAEMYLHAQSEALNLYRHICRKIPCNFEVKDSYVYSLDNKSKIEKELNALHSLGALADYTDSVNLPVNIAGAIKIKNQAQFHPIKFLLEISKSLPIYENTKVLEFTPNKAITKFGTISFKKAIIATHFPIINKHGGYFIKMYQHRSYVLALENAQDVGGMYVDENIEGLSFRNYEKTLLLGGGSHRTGKKGGNWRVLENFTKASYTKAKITGKWATQDCMTLDGIPYIGQYSKNTPDLYVATGFNKWGMTSAMVSAKILSDMIQDKDNPYASVFSPSRSILHSQLGVNIFESAVGLLTPTTPRCPHLGCALKYNKDEHSWDCACHGSRFSETGKVINNPATDDKKLK